MYQTGLPLAPDGPATCPQWACHLHSMGLPLVPCGPAVCTKWQAHFGVLRLRVGGKSAKGPGPHRRNPENLQKPAPVAKHLAAWAAFCGRKVGRGVPPSRRQGTRIAAAWKAAFPVSAYARSLNWENGRLARSMDGPCAAPATDETSVVPVSPPPALRTGMNMGITFIAFAAGRLGD